MSDVAIIARMISELREKELHLSEQLAFVRGKIEALTELSGTGREPSSQATAPARISPLERSPRVIDLRPPRHVQQPDGLKPADAVRDLLKQHPEGLTRKQIIDKLKDSIQSDSSDPRRLLYNTLYNLGKRGAVVVIPGPNGTELLKAA